MSQKAMPKKSATKSPSSGSKARESPKASASPDALQQKSPKKSDSKQETKAQPKPWGVPDSIALPLYFFSWYAGNVLFNKFNTAAVTEIGKEAGMTLTICKKHDTQK